MPANKYALLRYRIIDRKISSKQNPFPGKEALRQACEEELYGSNGDHISLSTIEKDLFAMRNEINLRYLAPIAFHKVRKGYYYEDPEYSIEQMPLNDDDLEAIAFAANTLSQFRNLDMFKSSEAAIEKILERFKLDPNNNTVSINHFVHFETAPVYKGGKHLRKVLDAIRHKNVITFKYEKYDGGQIRLYSLHPYLLKEYRNRWYIIGYNPHKDAVVVFGLDRVVETISVSTNQFIPQSEFDPKRYFEYSIGITAAKTAPQKIRLRFSPLAGKYVESQPLHPSQKIVQNDDAALEIEMYLCITKELIMTILSYGADVEVKCPENLKHQVANSLRNALKFY